MYLVNNYAEQSRDLVQIVIMITINGINVHSKTIVYSQLTLPRVIRNEKYF